MVARRAATPQGLRLRPRRAQRGRRGPCGRSRNRARSGGRLPRRSAGEIEATLDKIVALLKKHKEGMRAEAIRVASRCRPRRCPRILKEGLATKKLTSKGQKRATTYFAK